MRPTLLLIPGLLNTPRVFDRLRALWRDEDAALRVADIRQADSLAGMADAAWREVAQVPPDQPLVLAGYSLGGYVALQMLAEPRRPVQGLGLICTSARPDTAEGAVQRERAIAAIERDFARFVGALLKFLLSPQAQTDAELVATVRADMLAAGAAAAVRQHRAAAARPDRRGLLGQLQLPAAVLGAAADPVTPLQASEELAAGIAGATLERIEGAGHLVPFEHPDRLAAMLAGLVSRAA